MADDLKARLLGHIYGMDGKKATAARDLWAQHEDELGPMPKVMVDQIEDGMTTFLTDEDEPTTFTTKTTGRFEGEWLGDGKPASVRAMEAKRRQLEEGREVGTPDYTLPGEMRPLGMGAETGTPEMAGKVAREVAGFGAGLLTGGLGGAAVRAALPAMRAARAAATPLVGGAAGAAYGGVTGGTEGAIEGGTLGLALEPAAAGLAAGGRAAVGSGLDVLRATKAGQALERLRGAGYRKLPEKIPGAMPEDARLKAAEAAAKKTGREASVTLMGKPEALGKDPGKLVAVYERRFGKPYEAELAVADASPEASKLVEGADAIWESLEKSLKNKEWTEAERSSISDATDAVVAAIDEGMTNKTALQIRRHLDHVARAAGSTGKSPKDVALADAAQRAREIVARGPYAKASEIYKSGQDWIQEARVRLGLPTKREGELLPEMEKVGRTLAAPAETKGRLGGMPQKYPELASEIGAAEAARAASLKTTGEAAALQEALDVLTYRPGAGVPAAASAALYAAGAPGRAVAGATAARGGLQLAAPFTGRALIPGLESVQRTLRPRGVSPVPFLLPAGSFLQDALEQRRLDAERQRLETEEILRGLQGE